MFATKIKALAVAGVLSFVCATPSLAGEKLSNGAIKRLFPGQFAAVVQGYRVIFVAKSSGKLVGNYKGMSDTGRWSIRSGRLCIKMKSWLDGESKCGRVIRDGSWYRSNDVKFRKL